MILACSPKINQENQASTPQRPSGQRQGAPTYAQLVSEMDANKDGKLSKSEVKGPLQNDFAKIDLDGDGFISQTEFDKAPKPQRGSRPRPNNR